MPRPSTTKLSGTPDDPSAICTCSAGRRRCARTDRRCARGRRRRPRACHGSRCASIGTPRRLSSLSTGASAMHGTHQLAKILTSRGLPVARSAEDRPRLPGSAGGRVNAGTGRPSAARGCLSRRAASRHATAADEGSRRPAAGRNEGRGSFDASAPDRCARSRTSRPISASKPPKATSAPPSQINVTNGFHHSRNCQRPASCLPMTA